MHFIIIRDETILQYIIILHDINNVDILHIAISCITMYDDYCNDWTCCYPLKLPMLTLLDLVCKYNSISLPQQLLTVEVSNTTHTNNISYCMTFTATLNCF